MIEILVTDKYIDPRITFHISAYDDDGDQVDFDWADLFDLVLEKLGGSPCDVDDEDGAA